MSTKFVSTSAAPTSGQKLSILASKSGFVIPKNKLSGSLVPAFRGAKKPGATHEESSKQFERRTKWGPDLTQDSAVKRGKAFALQIRVDQITKQLESEKLEVGNNQNIPSGAENPDQSNSGPPINSKKSEMLELEKREAIGEILKLDPTYKPPPGFKPLLKEASIPLPVQEYPGYNFIGLIYGPEGDNQKRLEKETGTKIEVYGTKADTGDRADIKPGTDDQCNYKEVHVNISADSFDKVDEAVSIIELLITSVIGNLAAGSRDGNNVPRQNQNGPPSNMVSPALENQVAIQSIAVTQMHGDHLQYSGPWFSPVPSHNPVFASGNIAPPNASGHARTPHFLSQTMTPSNMVSTFGGQPVAGFQCAIPNQHVSMQAPPPGQFFRPSHMTQVSPAGHNGPPRNPSIISTQNLSAPANASISFPASLSQPTLMGQLRSPVSSMPQPMSGITPVPLANQPLTPLGDPSGQNAASAAVKASVGLSNMGPMAPPAVPPSRPVSLPPLSMAPQSATFSPRLTSSLGPMPHSCLNHLLGPVSYPSPGISPSLPSPQQSGIPNSASGVAPYHAHVKPPPVFTSSSSGNFTFQSQRPNSDISRQNSQAAALGGSQGPPAPRPPSFGFGVPDQPVQIFPRTQVPNQVDQTQANFSAVPFGGRSGSGSGSVPPRQTAFPYASQLAPRSPIPQMGMQNFISAPQMPHLHPRSMNIRQNYPSQRMWPDAPMPLNQKFGNNHSPYPPDQIYDPFSPTSVAPQQKGNPPK